MGIGEITIKDLKYMMEINGLIEKEDYDGVKKMLSGNPHFAHRFYTVVGGTVAFKALFPYLTEDGWDIERIRMENPEAIDFMDYLADTYEAQK